MSGNFDFTQLHKLESDDKLKMNVDEQICFLISMLKGQIRNWQVIAPTPKKRVIYFELEEGSRLDFVKGSMKELRKFAKR